jgi:hypothetical protein
MYDSIYKYTLETILDHINICNRRFLKLILQLILFQMIMEKLCSMPLLQGFKPLVKT